MPKKRRKKKKKDRDEGLNKKFMWAVIAIFVLFVAAYVGLQFYQAA